MNYLIFDMEWNQPSSQQEKNPALPHGEIIQIGYFVLSESLETLFHDEITVKPVCYPAMNPYVSALTGITQEQAEQGVPFPEAMRRLSEHFGEQTVLFTWGDDDMPILRENLAFHGLENSLPPHYNLQRFFCAQTQAPLRQIGLKTAAEHFEIDVNVQSHDALNDAYVTLLIARKLDLPRGMAEYAKPLKKAGKDQQQPWLSETPLFSANEEYSGSIDGLSAFCRSLALHCPVCGAALEAEPFCRHGKTSVVSILRCAEDGGFFERAELKEQQIKLCLYRLNGSLERVYKSRLRRKEKNERYRRLCRAGLKAKRKDPSGQ